MLHPVSCLHVLKNLVTQIAGFYLVTWYQIFPVTAMYPDIKSCHLGTDTGVQEAPVTQVIFVAVTTMLVGALIFSATEACNKKMNKTMKTYFLAHLTGELLVYQCFPLSSVCPPLSKIYFKIAWPIKVKFHVQPPWVGRMKVWYICVTCPKDVPHIWLKPFKNCLPNQKAYGLETLYVALGPWPMIVCSNDDPRLTMTCFTAMSNLVSHAFI